MRLNTEEAQSYGFGQSLEELKLEDEETKGGISQNVPQVEENGQEEQKVAAPPKRKRLPLAGDTASSDSDDNSDSNQPVIRKKKNLPAPSRSAA